MLRENTHASTLYNDSISKCIQKQMPMLLYIFVLNKRKQTQYIFYIKKIEGKKKDKGPGEAAGNKWQSVLLADILKSQWLYMY